MSNEEQILFVKQKHDADRAGLHFDHRLVIGGKAISWATRKDSSIPGSKLILWAQPDHTIEYALSKKIITPKGSYGAGITDLVYKQKGTAKFEYDKYYELNLDNGDRFYIKKMPSYGDKAWLLVNLTGMTPKGQEKKASMYKSALRRIISEIAKGNIKTPLKDLVAKAFVKSDATYARGMVIGNKNITKQVGAKVMPAKTPAHKLLVSFSGGYLTSPRKKGPTLILHNKKDSAIGNIVGTKSTHPAFIRHELFEGMDINHLAKNKANVYKIKTKGPIDAIRSMAGYVSPGDKKAIVSGAREHLKNSKGVNIAQFNNKITHGPRGMRTQNSTVGSHASPRVLTRESEMVRKNPHLQGVGTNIRNNNGESDIIKKITGKTYGVDKMTSRDHHKALHAKPARIEDNGHGGKTSVFEHKIKYKDVMKKFKEQYGGNL